MSVLVWDKPDPVRSKSDHAEISFDGGPPGGFVPNMSVDDQMKWKAKLVGQKSGYPQVEIRHNGAVIIVSYSGYKYKSYDSRQTSENHEKWEKLSRSGYSFARPVDEYKHCVHIASAGPIMLTLREFNDMNAAIAEAFAHLKQLIGNELHK